ncbi:uncharacterized protein EKO05_0009959 [Ascochyta rabiei]|nr:uncharacterized protein EKO05_0009959 [Ascochyta rabiei]UPX19705.1 hypothetical protein EKO05_0009959 [Ascochyta rabiei]
MHKVPHICNHCSRSFKRAEHLTRHLRTHTRDKPYKCSCGAAYTRRDLLTRHWRLSQHGGEAVTTTTKSTSADSRGTPQRLDTAQSQLLTYNGVTNTNLGSESIYHSMRETDYPTSVTNLHHTQVPFITQESQPHTCHEEGIQDFRDFVNFIDGVGLSAQWSPEFSFDWLQPGEQHPHQQQQRQESRRHSQERERTRSPAPEDIGTPFSTWLPSAPADDQVHLRSHSGDDVREKRSRSGTYNVTDDHRNFLVSLLTGFPAPISDFEIPSRHTLTRYITAFFGGFHSHFPYIHRSTFQPSCSPLELTLSMAAAGAQYCFEKRSSERLFRVAKAIVFERLRQEESYFGPQTLGLIASNDMYTPEAVPATRRTGPWAPLDMAKTLLTLVGFATWERKDLLQQAFCLRGLLVQTLRDIGLREESVGNTASTSKSAMWDQWVQLESARRTKLVAFCYINVHSIAYNIHPLLWSSELHLKLPCCTPQWQASSAAQWFALRRDNKEEQMPFQQALSLLLQGPTGSETVRPIPSPIGNYILLHAILQRIHVVRELSFPMTSSTKISASELQTVSRALRSWTSLWQQTPESILDPNNESGPIPFTSSALLVVAYVRLSLDIGQYRYLDSRDPTTIAAGLAQLPDIERNDNLLSALLYSTHALSIPVRLGIDRVARSQAFFWSVQHAISSFECAIFLAKWLCSLPNPLQEGSLSRSEHRILHWVRCIIREAYAVVDFDDAEDFHAELAVPTEPFPLGLAVLKIWCRFFRGNTQWQFVVNLGLSLELYMKTLE